MNQLEQLPDDSGATQEQPDNSTPKRALSSLKRAMDDADLSHPGVQKLILDRLDTAELQIERLEKFRSDYHETREELVVAKSSLKRLSSLDTMQSTLLGVGCLALGFLPSTWGNLPLTILMAVSGSFLVWASYKSKRSSQ